MIIPLYLCECLFIQLELKIKVFGCCATIFRDDENGLWCKTGAILAIPWMESPTLFVPFVFLPDMTIKMFLVLSNACCYMYLCKNVSTICTFFFSR